MDRWSIGKKSLKILSSEMDQAKISFIRKVFIKERSAEDFRKIHPSPILLELFKDSALPHTDVGNWETNCQRRSQHYIQLFATALWQNLGAVANGAKNILCPECMLAMALWMLPDIGNVISAAAQWTHPRYLKLINDAHRKGDGRIFSKNLRASLVNDDLSKKPNICRIHLAGQ